MYFITTTLREGSFYSRSSSLKVKVRESLKLRLTPWRSIMPSSSNTTKYPERTEEEEEEYSHDEYAATASEASDSPESASRAEGTSGKKNKQLLTREKLLTVKSDKLRRQLAPIRKWSSLNTGYPYLFRRVVAMEVKRKVQGADGSSSWELSHYAELGSDEEPLINAWLSSIMVKESENYNLGTEDVYIVPLRKCVSRENKREYQAFVIVRGDELVF